MGVISLPRDISQIWHAPPQGAGFYFFSFFFCLCLLSRPTVAHTSIWRRCSLKVPVVARVAYQPPGEEIIPTACVSNQYGICSLNLRSLKTSRYVFLRGPKAPSTVTHILIFSGMPTLPYATRWAPEVARVGCCHSSVGFGRPRQQGKAGRQDTGCLHCFVSVIYEAMSLSTSSRGRLRKKLFSRVSVKDTVTSPCCGATRVGVEAHQENIWLSSG